MNKVKFSEALGMYASWKKSNVGSAVLNSKDVAAVRKAYNEGAFEKEFEKRIAERKVTKATKVEESKNDNAAKIVAYREWKEKNHGTRAVSLRERQLLCTPSGTVELEDNRKDHFLGINEETDNEETVTAKNALREARRCAFTANKLLKENDMVGAADMTQQAGVAVNAADAAVATGAVPENVVASVQNVKSAVDELAAQCGLAAPVDLGADPAAGIPAVNGAVDPAAAPIDPAAANPAPVMESKEENAELDAIKERLAKREQALATMSENFIDDAMKAAEAEVTFPNVDKTNSEEQVKVSTKKSPEAAATWPTEKISVKEGEEVVENKIEEKSESEKMVDAKLAEAENNWDFSKILSTGILG